jgi:hypothetical protein
LLLLLRPDQQEVEHAEDQKQGQELRHPARATEHIAQTLGMGGGDKHYRGPCGERSRDHTFRAPFVKFVWNS